MFTARALAEYMYFAGNVQHMTTVFKFLIFLKSGGSEEGVSHLSAPIAADAHALELNAYYQGCKKS